MSTKFKIGDRVTLSENSEWFSEDSYDMRSCNPINCQGTVIRAPNDLRVEWDNGIINSCYSESCLDLVETQTRPPSIEITFSSEIPKEEQEEITQEMISSIPFKIPKGYILIWVTDTDTDSIIAEIQYAKQIQR